MRGLYAALAALLCASSGSAQSLRELCSDRPGLGTPPCVVDPGHLQIELGLGDWTLDKQTDNRTDTIRAGELLARYGITRTTEVRLAWTGYGRVRERDRSSGQIDRQSGTGDVTLGVLQSLKNPEGDGVSLALLPQVTLPAGGRAIGDGTWSAGLLVPMAFDLSNTFQLTVTSEVDATANESRQGRHLTYGGTIGIVTKLGEKADVTTEFQAMRDRDPEEKTTKVLASIALDYKPVKMLQLDMQAVAGLNRNSPDVQLLFGISRKF